MFRLLLIASSVWLLSLTSSSPVLAQAPAGNPQSGQGSGSQSGASTNQGAGAQGGGAAPATVSRLPGSLPPSPYGFFRGNEPSEPGFAGFYLNMLIFVPVFGLFFAWASTTNWVNSDAGSLKLPTDIWCSAVMGGGAVGFIAVLLLPSVAFGLLLLVAGYAVPVGLYVRERNSRVPESSQVLTPRHLRNVGIRLLSKIGINLGSREVREAAVGPPIHFMGKSRTGAGKDDSRSKQVENSKGYMAAKEVIYDALLRRATDVHLEPTESELHCRYRIDGVMYPTEPFDRAVGDAIINIFKVLSAMDITEKRKPQDGSLRAEVEGREIDFRVATQGTGVGEKMSIRILDQTNSVKTLATLGMRKQLADQIAEIVHQPHGLFLVCGPTGAGKSTTLYAALQELDPLQQNIITVEDPIEYRMKSVTQIEINTKAGQTFAGSLRSILRQDPDVVLIGEMRDEETAKIACQAANTGHMVFSTIHANESIAALFRILDLGVEPFVLSTSISGILAQRLCRKLCEECKESYEPSADFLKKANLPADKIETLYRPPTDPKQTCAVCGGLGYKGRIGVFELFITNDRIRDMVRDNPQLSAIKAEARKNGMLYMKEEGLRLVVKGTTSVQELLRVVK